MTRAARYNNLTTVAKELNDYYVSAVTDDLRQEALALDEAYDELYYETIFGETSRVGWLIANKGLTLIEAVKCAAEEEKQWAESTFEWFCDPKNESFEIYSDIYKDYYGFRPR